MDDGGSLYDAVGGTDGLRRLSDSFYERVLADEVLAPVFATFTPDHVEHVAVWLGEVFGGAGAVHGGPRRPPGSAAQPPRPGHP